MKGFLRRVLGARVYQRVGQLSIFSGFRSLGLWPRYFREKASFKSKGGKVTHSFPILSEYNDDAGTAVGHYFHQDLLVAGFINEARPKRHIDIGSRIDGFVAHVAAFRPIEIVDIRELPPTNHPNIEFRKADFMAKDASGLGLSDSISCLHAIEHFGLGRYSDPIDPSGHLEAFENLVRILAPGGRMYISFPIGRSNEVHFNAHRVFDPLDIFTWPGTSDFLQLERFDFVDDEGSLHRDYPLLKESPPQAVYGCGIYTFSKKK